MIHLKYMCFILAKVCMLRGFKMANYLNQPNWTIYSVKSKTADDILKILSTFTTTETVQLVKFLLEQW